MNESTIAQLMALLQQGGMPNQAFANAPAAAGPRRQGEAAITQGLLSNLMPRKGGDLASAMRLSFALADEQMGLPPGTMLKRTLLEAIAQAQGAQMVPDSALDVGPIAAPQMPRR